MINQVINQTAQFLAVDLDINCAKFLNYKECIPRKARGVYVIAGNDKVYYVGKGNIRDRQKMHVEKFLGEFKYAADTRGFKKLRETVDYDIDNFDIYWLSVSNESLIGALEGILIYKLQPLANDECIID